MVSIALTRVIARRLFLPTTVERFPTLGKTHSATFSLHMISD
jgi:hypothetical protein